MPCVGVADGKREHGSVPRSKGGPYTPHRNEGFNDVPEGRAVMPPILADKHYRAPSAFTPESLLREARRQRALANGAVPAICLLDPDGDLVRRLKEENRATRDPAWACYHTELHRFAEAE